MRLDDFFKFMAERQRIWRVRHEGAPPPWTDDRVLRAYRFCNIFRELDTETIWIRENWRTPYKDHPNLPLAMVLARLVNWHETLEEIGFPERWDPRRLVRVMESRRARGLKVRTSAFQVWCPEGMTNADRFVMTIQSVIKLGEWVQPTLCETVAALTQAWGLGRFTAYEIVTDLRHTKWLRHAPDVMTWCNIGQGSERGLNRLIGRPLNGHVPEAQAVAEVLEVLAAARKSALLKKADPMFKTLEPRDIEHALCEFDKYERFLALPKNKFRKERYV